MTAPSGYTIRYDIKSEPRKFRYGSQHLQDFVHHLRQEAVLLAEKVGVKAVAEKIRCCARSVKNWTKRWERGGFAALRDKSRRPKEVHHLEREKVDKIGASGTARDMDVRRSRSTSNARPAPFTSTSRSTPGR